MEMLNTNLALATTAIAVVVIFPLLALVRMKRRLISKEGYPLPPGPPASWFWGNLIPTFKSGTPP